MTSNKDSVKYIVPLVNLINYYALIVELSLGLKEEINKLSGPVVTIGAKQKRDNLKAILGEQEFKMKSIMDYFTENGTVLTYNQIANIFGRDLEEVLATGERKGKFIYL